MTLVETIRRIAPLFQLEPQFASFSIFVCVARIFNRHLSGTLEAGKLLARANSVKSGMAQWQRKSERSLRRGDRSPVKDKSAPKSAAGFFFVFFRTRVFLFLVKKIFVRDENKISNKVHFFLVVFESDF